MKIAIQGTKSSFHAVAARRLFGTETELIYCETFHQVFASLAQQQANFGVLAIENSLYGSINDVYDLLLKYNFWICGEVYEQISLQLLGSPLATLETITKVYSQAPALAEAEFFLDTNLPHAQREEYYDTGAAAAMVAAENNPSKAAIASAQAADEYDLSILASNIETHPHNYTRFIALAPTRLSIPPEANKTSITFRSADKPGSLHAALGVFANHGINLTKLESRPIIGSAWQYMYYVDFSLGGQNGVEQEIIGELSQFAYEIRVLGSYRSGAVEKA